MTQEEYQLLTRIEQGTTVFRPNHQGPGVDPEFSKTVDVLMRLRSQGWVKLADTRIARDAAGRVLLVGPCDLTEAGRRALEQDRRLGPRG